MCGGEPRKEAIWLEARESVQDKVAISFISWSADGDVDMPRLEMWGEDGKRDRQQLARSADVSENQVHALTPVQLSKISVKGQSENSLENQS